MSKASVSLLPRKRILFIVSAPSGSGKTSLCRCVVRKVSQLSFSISHTTRAPRAGEKDGRDYFFVSQEDFQRFLNEGKMAEWTTIYGNHYGTAKATIQEKMAKGYDLLFDIDERGARQLVKEYPDSVTILILPPSLRDLEKRLLDRATDNRETIHRRLKKARAEIEKMLWYQYVIVNDEFDEALLKLSSIIIAERCRRSHMVIDAILKDEK